MERCTRNIKRTYTTKSDGTPYARRNLVTISRYTVREKHQYFHEFTPAPMWRITTAQPPESEAQKVEWERPILHCEIALAGNRILHAINLHPKSKNPTDIAGQKSDPYSWLTHEGWAEGYFLSSVKRVGQALETRRLIGQLFKQDPQALIAIGGDFNADANSVPFKTIVGSVEDTNNQT
ncbi:MAG: endonuclease/exonuclease/phosphatase family protein [Thermoproteota archaeon]